MMELVLVSRYVVLGSGEKSKDVIRYEALHVAWYDATLWHASREEEKSWHPN